MSEHSETKLKFEIDNWTAEVSTVEWVHTTSNSNDCNSARSTRLLVVGLFCLLRDDESGSVAVETGKTATICSCLWTLIYRHRHSDQLRTAS